MPIDVPPSADLILAPSVQAGVEHLLHAWQRGPYGNDFPLVAAKIEPQVVHLAASASPTAAEVTLRYHNAPPWFVVNTPGAWSPSAAQVLRAEVQRAFPTNPWTPAGRPNPHAQEKAADAGALAAEALLGPPASVPVISPAYAIGAGAGSLAVPLLVSWWLLFSRRAKGGPRPVQTK